jgi:predicted protein tyrosine phosphatase
MVRTMTPQPLTPVEPALIWKDIRPLIAEAPDHPNGWCCAMRVMGQTEARHLAELLSPTHLISIRAPGARDLGPAGLVVADRLSLEVDDTLDPSVAPTMQVVLGRALDFVHALPSEARLLVHCAAGVSRSTALCLAILARYAGPERAGPLLHGLRRSAVPNLLMVEEADRMLGAAGRLIATAKRFPCRSWDVW